MINIVTLYHGDDFNGAMVECSIKGNKLDTTRMHTGNLQTGTGVSFDKKISVAESYGKNITTTQANHNHFLNSREPMGEELEAFYQLNHPQTQIDSVELLTDLMLDMHIENVKNLDELDLFEVGVYNLATDWFAIDEEEFTQEIKKQRKLAISFRPCDKYSKVQNKYSEVFEETRSYINTLVSNIMDDEVRNFQITMADTFTIQSFQNAWKEHLPTAVGTYDKNTEFYAIINDKDLEIKKHILQKEKKSSKSQGR